MPYFYFLNILQYGGPKENELDVNILYEHLLRHSAYLSKLQNYKRKIVNQMLMQFIKLVIKQLSGFNTNFTSFIVLYNINRSFEIKKSFFCSVKNNCSSHFLIFINKPLLFFQRYMQIITLLKIFILIGIIYYIKELSFMCVEGINMVHRALH